MCLVEWYASTVTKKNILGLILGRALQAKLLITNPSFVPLHIYFKKTDQTLQL